MCTTAERKGLKRETQVALSFQFVDTVCRTSFWPPILETFKYHRVLVYKHMCPVSKWEIYEYLEAQKDAIDAEASKHKSNKVRQFIRDFKQQHALNEAAVDTMYAEFCGAHPEVPMKDTYFRTICEKTWETHVVTHLVDGKNVRTVMINLNKEKRKT